MAVDSMDVIRTLRIQAWERAKGELESIIATFLSSPIEAEKYEKFKKLTDSFVKTVEEEGLQE